MEPYEILGIVFRSRGHAVWVGIGLYSLVSHIVHQLFIRVVKPSFASRFTFILVVFYGSVTVQAIVATQGGRREVGPYSADCIWFNALMILSHVLIWMRLPYKPPRIDIHLQ